MEPRFRQGTSNLIAAQVEQARQRATGRLLSVVEFIPIRRKSYAWTITEGTVVHAVARLTFESFSHYRLPAALVEYVEDVHIPEDVWDHAIMHELSDAIGDISGWANVSPRSLSN